MARAFLRFVDRSVGRLMVRALILYDRLRRSLGRIGGRTAAGDIPPGRPSSILVIKLVGLGDTVLMLTPLARLRRLFPGAGITALVTPLSLGILEAQPSVDRTVVYDVFGRDRGLLGLMKVVRLLRGRRFDCVIDFEQHFQMTSVLSYLTGAPTRIGFYYPGSPRRGLFTHPVFLDPEGHMVDAYMALLRPLGLESGRVDSLEPINVAPGDELLVEEWLKGRGVSRGDLLVGVHSGSGIRAPVRRWGAEKFAEIIRRLREAYGSKTVLTGGADERERVDEIIRLAGVDGVFNASGEFTILQTAALMARCRLFISNDTGPLHMSAAMGIPTIGLFGPNSPARYAPVGRDNMSIFRGISCSPCIQIHKGRIDDCSGGICMKQITVEEVWDAVKHYNLNRTGGAPVDGVTA